MSIQASTLDVLFRKVSPSEVYDRLKAAGETGDPGDAQILFQKYAIHTLKGYSKDEVAEISQAIKEEAEETRKKLFRIGWEDERTPPFPPLTQASMALYSVLILANQLLGHWGQEPFCKIENVGEWRNAYLYLGQDLFVCAYLACEDIKSGYERLDFAWPAILRTNHSGLNALLKKGIAENHQHLYGSSQTFALSWCSLMNYPDTHRLIAKLFKELYQPYTAIGPERRFVTTQERVRYACYFRMQIFEWLQSENRSAAPEWAKDYDHKRVSWGWMRDLIPTFEQVSALREVYGAKVSYDGGRKKACLDYTFTQKLYVNNPNACYRFLAGERYFLYLYFRYFLLGKTDPQLDFLFYLYLILKTLFRSELVQANDLVGFQNFSDYQDRKKALCKQPFYQTELIRMAINAPLKEGFVDSLETRIAPENTPQCYRDNVSGIDKLKNENDQNSAQPDFFPKCIVAEAKITAKETPHYYSIITNKINCYRSRVYDLPEAFSSQGSDFISPYFFVIHFIKMADKEFLNYIKRRENNRSSFPGEFLPYRLCRHERLRDDVSLQARALSIALHSWQELRGRIRGIDCASSEVVCPPETFAMAYRILRGHKEPTFQNPSFFPSKPFSLSATYHVAEDFLDILSALRAIDEAVNFLELRRNDRIGHALGLGVDPETHYSLKGRRIFLPKQQRLDDLVWLLIHCRDLGLHIDPHVYGKLKEEAELLFFEIYGSAMERLGWNIHLTEYYCSMCLRADDPTLYRNWHNDHKYPDFLGVTDSIPSPYESFRFSRYSEALPSYRKSLYLTGLYYLYHYGMEERKKGNETATVLIDKDYMRLMTEAQNVLQREVAKKGIIIECNPSSNVLIGTFKDYAKHPVFRFNHTGLQGSNLPEQTGEPLQVCINTDDLGVFDTSLEFEYALLFDALNNQFDNQGKKIYSESVILEYLDRVRIMGQQAVFPPI